MSASASPAPEPTLEPEEGPIARALEGALGPLGFVPRSHPPSVGERDLLRLWTRKTWQTNRAVALLRLPDGLVPGPLTQPLKLSLGKLAGYVPVLYGCGLQVVWVGVDVETTSDALQSHVDTYDNQRCVLQSLFVADVRRRAVHAARTWGQVITGRFQDAIQAGLEAALRGPGAGPSVA